MAVPRATARSLFAGGTLCSGGAGVDGLAAPRNGSVAFAVAAGTAVEEKRLDGLEQMCNMLQQ